LADTFTIAGKHVKKSTAYGIGVVAVGVVAVAVYRSKHAKTAAAAPAAAASTAGDPYPPDGTTGNPGDLYSTDPATGMTYGDEQSQAAGSTGYDAAGYPLGSQADLAYEQSQGSSGVPVAYPVTGSGSGGTGTGGVTFTDNASWAQYIEAYMVNNLGASAETVGNALGKYITGQPVVAAQQSIIEQAIAFAGPPPVAGTNGMPPSINLAKSGGGGGHPKHVPAHTVTANGHQDLQQIAIASGVTEAEVAKANPALAKKYEGTGHDLPKGTRVTIPAHTEKT